MRSCADRLHQLQRDVGLSDKELKQAVKDVCTPRQVSLPVLHEKSSVESRIGEKLTQKSKKKQKTQIAAWYLEEYLVPDVAQRLYMAYPVFKELVNHAYEEAMNIIQLLTFETGKEVDFDRVFPGRPLDDLDIPDEQWEAFGKYCKDHPIASAKDIWKRREKFKKTLTKKRYKLYSPRRLRMYDPYYAATALDAKEMVKNIKAIGKANEVRIQKFHEMLDELVKDQSIGSEAMKQFSKQTEELMKQHQRRLHQFIKRTGKGTPTPIQFDWDEQSILYDDYGNPDSMDSVFGKRLGDL